MGDIDTTKEPNALEELTAPNDGSIETAQNPSDADGRGPGFVPIEQTVPAGGTGPIKQPVNPANE